MHRLVLLSVPIAIVLAATGASGAESPRAEAPADADLVGTITALDGAFFDAYNRCELERFASYLAPDVEFYHDKAGFTRTRDELVDGVRRNICGKLTRELVAGSLEVYPIKGFGAVEFGTHRFCHVGASRCEGIGKFTTIWENRNGNWRITRAISYDHRSIEP